MIPLADAVARVFDAVAPLPVVEVPAREAHGFVLARPVVAPEPVPPFANTAMDGYAVRAADTSGATEAQPVRLRVVDELPAGRAPSTPVGAGEAIRIMTGAPMPPGADAIVMVERTRVDGAAREAVLVDAPAAVGDHVREAGGDVAPGTTVFPAGTALGPAHVGVLVSLGLTSVAVHRRPRVGVCSTGDELVAEPGPLAPGRIRDSNRPMLLALVAEAGCDAVDLGLAPDDEAAITAVVARALDECDALVTSGGVSVGDYDYVKQVLRAAADARPDSHMAWMQIAIKPAKPFAFGVLGGVPVFGLPGNPVSSNVSFELFARPALRRMAGHERWFRPEVDAVALEPLRRKPDGKTHFDRVRVEWDDDRGAYVCGRTGSQSSNVLSAMALANALAVLPDGVGVEAGEPVRVRLLGPV